MENQWMEDMALVDPDKKPTKLFYDPETGNKVRHVEKEVKEIIEDNNPDNDSVFEQYWY